MNTVLVVPGAAVRAYVRPAVEAVRERGVDAELLPAPGEPPRRRQGRPLDRSAG